MIKIVTDIFYEWMLLPFEKMLGPKITDRTPIYVENIPAGERLALTLRFLAMGTCI